MTDYLTPAEVLAIHADQIERYGGSPGGRDAGLLEAALYRPQTGYYADLIEEAAALMGGGREFRVASRKNLRPVTRPAVKLSTIHDPRFTGRRQSPLAAALLARLELRPNDRVLDIGCGDGWAARMLAPRLPDGAVVGIDAAAETIREARRLSGALDNVLFAPAPAERIPWAEDYFTHVIGIEAACSWPSPERVAQEIFRVAAYGGRFHLVFHSSMQSPRSHERPAGKEPAMQIEGAGEWVDLFRAAGFEQVTAERIPGDPPLPGSERERGGALYVTGRKPALPLRSAPPPDPLRVLD